MISQINAFDVLAENLDKTFESSSKKEKRKERRKKNCKRRADHRKQQADETIGQHDGLLDTQVLCPRSIDPVHPLL